MRLAWIALLFAPSVAWAQASGSGANVNPIPGSVWTYLGNTYGSGWAPSIGSIPFHLQGTMDGNKLSGNSPGDFGGVWTMSGVSVTNDTATNTLPSSNLPAWSVVHQFGGADAGEGSRVGIWSNLLQTGPVARGTALNHFHTGIFSNVNVNYNDGGVGGSEHIGQAYGYAGQIAAGSGYNHTYGIVGGEIDVANSSTSAAIVEGWAVASAPLSYGNPTQHGVLYDAGYGEWSSAGCGAGSLSGGSGCIGFSIGLSFGRFDAYFPIDPLGTIIATTQGVSTLGNMKAQHGIDFHNMTFSGQSLYLPGFTVDGNGNLKMTSPSTTINLRDTTQTDTNGGRIRLTSLSSNPDGWEWQINTAAGGDFSTALSAWRMGSDGTLTTFVAPIFNVGAIMGPAPGSFIPPLHFYTLYVDPVDNKLKARASTGTITILASP